MIKVDGLILLSRRSDGKIHVDDDFHTARKGAGWGAVGGAVIGLIFPPTLLAGALVGAGVGAGVGGARVRTARGRRRSRQRSRTHCHSTVPASWRCSNSSATLTGRQRGALVRALAAQAHTEPDGRIVRITRWTLDR